MEGPGSSMLSNQKRKFRPVPPLHSTEHLPKYFSHIAITATGAVWHMEKLRHRDSQQRAN